MIRRCVIHSKDIYLFNKSPGTREKVGDRILSTRTETRVVGNLGFQIEIKVGWSIILKIFPSGLVSCFSPRPFFFFPSRSCSSVLLFFFPSDCSVLIHFIFLQFPSLKPFNRCPLGRFTQEKEGERGRPRDTIHTRSLKMAWIDRANRRVANSSFGRYFRLEHSGSKKERKGSRFFTEIRAGLAT